MLLGQNPLSNISINLGSSTPTPDLGGAAKLAPITNTQTPQLNQTTARQLQTGQITPAQAQKIINPTTSPTMANTPVKTTTNASDIPQTKAYTVAPEPVATGYEGLGGAADATFGNINQNQAVTAVQNAPQEKTQSNNVTTRISDIFGVDPKDLMTQLGQKGQRTADLQDQFDVAGKTQVATETYNQYKQAKLALQQQIEKIRTTPNQTAEQAQQQINEVTAKGNANLANLAVIAEASQGSLQAAQNIVKMKLDAEFEPIQTQIDNLGKFYQLNQNDLTDSEKIQLENQRFQMQNNLDQLKSAKESAHTFALQSGITDANVLNAIDSAKTPSEAYQAVQSIPGSQQFFSGQSFVPAQLQPYLNTTQQGGQYINLDKVPKAYQSQVQALGAQSGVAVLSGEEVTKVRSIDVTKNNLEKMSSAVSKILGSGVTGRITGSISNWIKDKFQSDPEVSSFNTYRDTAINAIQALAGGSGSGFRLNQAEIDTATRNLPTIYDNIETAQAKLAKVNSFLDEWTKQLLPNSSATSKSSGSLYDF